MSSILIIDDSPEDREMLSDLLQQADPTVSVTECPGGEDGIAAAEEQAVDCVLLDLRLEGESGLDVLSEIKNRHPDLPVIVLTGQGSEEAAAEAFVAGAAYYVTKTGLNSQTLWTAVTRVIRQAAKDRELKSKRDAMERSNRLDAVGQLAAGIAHDFNNQLGALRYCMELLKEASASGKTDKQVHAALKIIEESAALASRLLSLSRQGDLFAEAVPLKDAFEDLKVLALPSIAAQVSLDLKTPDDDLMVFCDRGQLLNVLLNLVLNANDAIVAKGDGGTVTLQASKRAETVAIVVSDNGIGMPDDILAKSCDPFFTTKKETNGTGLGLATAQGFASENGGELLIESVEGAGTEVALGLPIAVNGQTGEETDTSATLEVPVAARILIVEDQIILAQMTKEILQNAGYNVEMVHDAESSLQLLSTDYRPDVILTDVKMPGMNGFEMANRVRRQSPEIGIIYLTGYADNPQHPKQDIHGPVLQKPVAPKELIATINKVLSQ